MRSRTIFAVAGLALVGLVSLEWARGGAGGAAGDEALIVDRVWTDSRPDKYTDYQQILYLISRSPLGIFQKASAYDMRMELVEYSRNGSEVKLVFPQTGKQ